MGITRKSCLAGGRGADPKDKLALHLQECQDLLNIKWALDIEMATCRKVL